MNYEILQHNPIYNLKIFVSLACYVLHKIKEKNSIPISKLQCISQTHKMNIIMCVAHQMKWYKQYLENAFCKQQWPIDKHI